jgi:hypothetical protein
MGEDMNRVKEGAAAMGADVYKPWGMKNGWDPGLAMQRNERWINDQINAGHILVDVGPSFDRRAKREIMKWNGET